MIFLDTNVIIDVLEPQQSAEALWSRQTFTRLSASERLVSNFVVVAELVSGLADADKLLQSLAEAEIEILELGLPVALRAGTAFGEYRRRGGKKQAMLADFLIAAHAASLNAPLMTRDRRVASYFPDLTLMAPETNHG